MVTLSAEGVPQGGPVSPVLSNIYLHYVLDLWFERRFKKTCRGYAELTRFADDFVAAFRNQEDAERFRQEMEERLAAFGLRVAPEKTALLHFDGDLLQAGDRPEKPGTFTFLGFTHFLAKTRRGILNIVRTPSVKARERFVRKVRTWLKVNRHQPVREQQAHLDEDAQRLLPVLRAAAVLHVLIRRPSASSSELGMGVEASKPESEATPRLGESADQILVPTPASTRDAGVGLATDACARPICSGEPGAGNPHAGF